MSSCRRKSGEQRCSHGQCRVDVEVLVASFGAGETEESVASFSRLAVANEPPCFGSSAKLKERAAKVDSQGDSGARKQPMAIGSGQICETSWLLVAAEKEKKRAYPLKSERNAEGPDVLATQ